MAGMEGPHNVVGQPCAETLLRADTKPPQDVAEAERLELERLQKERLLAEKQERRAAVVAASIRKFLADFQAASKPGAAQAAAAAAGGKPGKGGKAATGKAAKAQPAKGKEASSGKDGKKKTATNPKAEVWAAFLAELDEKVNKTKKCGLENFYQAIGRLDPCEQQVLSSILASTTRKELPTANMTEPVLTIKETFYAATAAFGYTACKVLDASSRPAHVFRECGVSARGALDAGFRVGQLSRAGYSARELVESCLDLSEVRQGGISIADVISANMHSLEGVAGAKQLKAAGYTATAIQEAAAGAIGAWDLRLAGYSHPASATGSSTTGSIASTSGRAAAQQAHMQGLTQQLQRRKGLQACCSSGVSELIHELQYTAPGLGIMHPATAIEYFRQGIKPVMHMEAERDMPVAVLGTRKQDQAGPVAEPSTRQRGGKAGNAFRRSIEGESSATSLSDSPVRRRGRPGMPLHGMPAAATATGGTKDVAVGMTAPAAAAPGGHLAAVNRHALHPSRFVSDSMASTHEEEDY